MDLSLKPIEIYFGGCSHKGINVKGKDPLEIFLTQKWQKTVGRRKEYNCYVNGKACLVLAEYGSIIFSFNKNHLRNELEDGKCIRIRADNV